MRKARSLKGGGLDCEAEGFNLAIRQATFGADYPNAIVSHEDSESWSYDQLVDISTRGLVGWYCKRASLTPDECAVITSMPEVQILGAFFHRYKVFSEHISRTKGKLRRLTVDFVPNDFSNKLSTKTNNIAKRYTKYLPLIKNMIEHFDEFQVADLSIETAIDRSQCLLWTIVKNRGLPEGFIMDDRIEKRAREPIRLKDPDFKDILTYPDVIRVSSTHLDKSPVVVNRMGILIERVLEDKMELEDPPVTFGVF